MRRCQIQCARELEIESGQIMKTSQALWRKRRGTLLNVSKLGQRAYAGIYKIELMFEPILPNAAAGKIVDVEDSCARVTFKSANDIKC